MEPVDQKLVSSWYDVQSVPQTFVQPPEKWPGKDIDVPLCKNIPVVDLRGPDWSRTIEQISEAIQEFGFFQVQKRKKNKKNHAPSSILVFYTSFILLFTFKFGHMRIRTSYKFSITEQTIVYNIV